MITFARISYLLQVATRAALVPIFINRQFREVLKLPSYIINV